MALAVDAAVPSAALDKALKNTSARMYFTYLVYARGDFPGQCGGPHRAGVFTQPGDHDG
jgi:hypothetical protein